jgi:hypothetical protein
MMTGKKSLMGSVQCTGYYEIGIFWNDDWGGWIHVGADVPKEVQEPECFY